jgi:hypothetical protein
VFGNKNRCVYSQQRLKPQEEKEEESRHPSGSATDGSQVISRRCIKCSNYFTSRTIAFDSLGGTEEEAVMVHYKLFSRHSLMLAKENYDIPQVCSASFQNECSNFPYTSIRLNRLAVRWRNSKKYDSRLEEDTSCTPCIVS